ncbi:ABC-type transport system, substrate-binding protein [Sinosporangium album]|uniref:ABC-type transport system, substrate-binding protein n=1 Tax=Sinosporangium album TaxID=504805 RepID=A0A1G8HJQ9_9ACTN|nr:ABC transporter substrate-binding protein [Sinosporangium album]SDI06889.1 ABC-type transport system, substrate-binding protein [Sinosporangium album]
MSRTVSRRRSRPGASRVLAGVVLLAVLAAGCGGGAAPDRSAAYGGLRLAVPEPRASVQPRGFAGYSISSYGVGEHLLRARPDGTVEPWLAQSYERVGPTVWRVRLRGDVTFHNGRPVDAPAVVAALRRQVEAGYGNDAVAKAELKAEGPLTVTLTTEKPSGAVPRDLASLHRYYMIYDAAAAEKAGTDEQKLLAAGIYTGPYKPVSINQQQITARPYDGYWGPEPALPEIRILSIGDPEARLAAVRSGEADIALSPPAESIRSIGRAGGIVYRRAELAQRAAYMQLNLRRPPFDDLAARRAFLLGIDYARLSAVAAGGGVFDRAVGLMPVSLPFGVETQRTDASAAAALLQEAGWTAGPDGVRVKDGTPLRVHYQHEGGYPEYEAIGVVLRDMLRPLGFDVTLGRIEDAYAPESWPDTWSASVVALSLDGASVVDMVSGWLVGGGGANFGGIADDRVDALAARLQASPLADAHGSLRELQKLIADRAYAGVLAFRPVDAVVNTRFSDYRPDPGFVFVEAGLTERRGA